MQRRARSKASAKRFAPPRGEAGRIAVEENGTRYFADLAGGQKTGWYYDQRDNRAFMAGLAKGKSVLDAYSYTGGFGIAAARAGATETICLDSSAPALALAEESAAANAVAIKAVKADVFEEMERLAGAKEVFDIVIADPPPFVRARKDLEPGAKAYRKLARLSGGGHGRRADSCCSRRARTTSRWSALPANARQDSHERDGARR
ncbi:MAG: class I SAM-dependent methyltransferase [Rhizomicrobium sp.]